MVLYSLVCILAWTFTARPAYVCIDPAVIGGHTYPDGYFHSGITLSSGNIGLKLAPKGQATSYLATSSFINSLAAGIAPILADYLQIFFKPKTLDEHWMGKSGKDS